MSTFHPHPDEHGQPVLLRSPSVCSGPQCWDDPQTVVTVIPASQVPPALNAIALADWHDVPVSIEGWNEVEGQLAFNEPPFIVPAGKAPASGVVIIEDDGRIWLVSPSNAFGGYRNTFPKGRIESGMHRQASAIREAFEESGLKVEIAGFLADSSRTLTFTRYYLARRTGGNPASMGWESQAVHLVPPHALALFLTHPNDLPLLAAIAALNAG
ncbi:MAG: hydrolase [Massilia sp.]|jgi:ADP-ribose pyrophosphatase YjhB (NUDIX family)|nr:hydrolase [Massilia sp.]